MGSQSSRDQNQNLEGLFKCPLFYGELSREDATETLNEAGKNVGESWPKDILFLETVSDDFGQNRFALIAAFRRNEILRGIAIPTLEPKFLYQQTTRQYYR